VLFATSLSVRIGCVSQQLLISPMQKAMEAHASAHQPIVVRMKHGRLVKGAVPRHRQVERSRKNSVLVRLLQPKDMPPVCLTKMTRVYNFDERSMLLMAHGTTVPVMNVNGIAWFRGKDCAEIMNYKDSKKAIKAHVDLDWQKTMQELLQTGGGFCPPDHTRTLNDLSAKWISESGLFELASSSKLPAARAFRKWVFGEVLPSIRKTGSYSVQPAAPAATPIDGWLDKRLEGKELMKVKNASLQQLIAGGFGQTGCELYKIVANHINQAVLGFTQTTTSFKKQQQLPRHVSIPDILNMQGQVARCYAETCFHQFVSDNLQRLRGLPKQDLIKEFTDRKVNLRQAFVSTGMGDLQSK